jgi:sugar phosphate isomerase/epimerase
MSTVASPYAFLTVGATDTALLAELNLGVEGSITADGDVRLPELAAPYLFSIHLPYSREGTRFNGGSPDETVRQDVIGRVTAAIDTAVKLGAKRGVIHPMGIQRWEGSVEATWEHTVRSIAAVVDHATAAGLQICLENNVYYWSGVADETPPEQGLEQRTNHIFGSTPREWLDLWRAVDRPQLRLCLDTSHAATYAARSSDPDEAARLLDEFLVEPDLIAHVHWSDSWLCDPRGRRDAHLHVGTGTLPRAFHARVKGLAATKHLEHQTTPDQLRAELAYIAAL